MSAERADGGPSLGNEESRRNRWCMRVWLRGGGTCDEGTLGGDMVGAISDRRTKASEYDDDDVEEDEEKEVRDDDDDIVRV